MDRGPGSGRRRVPPGRQRRPSMRRPRSIRRSTRRGWPPSSARRSPRATRRASGPAPRPAPNAPMRCCGAWRRRSRSSASCAASMIRQTERQMVQLALAIARRIVRREVALDQRTHRWRWRAWPSNGSATAPPATIRLHPDDYAATCRQAQGPPGAAATWLSSPTRSLSRGGCMVESDFGFVDASVDAQFHEIARGAARPRTAQETAVAVNRGR